MSAVLGGPNVGPLRRDTREGEVAEAEEERNAWIDFDTTLRVKVGERYGRTPPHGFSVVLVDGGGGNLVMEITPFREV